METNKIICDNCKADLTTTGNSIDYRLALISQLIPGWGGAVTDMLISPPIDRSHHFCHMGCLREWIAKPIED
jgi:hypothetical protein